MKTEQELNKDIIDITMDIKENYPELSKYIAEMPITIPIIDNPKINVKSLQEYYNSLDELLKKYAIDHDIIKNP